MMFASLSLKLSYAYPSPKLQELDIEMKPQRPKKKTNDLKH
jgi:hypothetical protein